MSLVCNDRQPSQQDRRCDNESSAGSWTEPLNPGAVLKNLRVLSTHLFLHQRLHPGLLDLAAKAGVEGIEIFAARQHFDYTDHEEVAELADWFRANPLQPFSMHAPLYPDKEMGRDGAPAIDLLHPEKAHRIAAMDEIKRALETAEQIPFKNLIVHLGERGVAWSTEALEYSLTALEHLGAFAHPLGVRLLVENLLNEATAPEHLNTLLETGHLDSVGVCLDMGHAHIALGVPDTIEILGKRIVSVHVHDNHMVRDEHLWPGEGTIDWTAVSKTLAALATPPATVLEIHPTQLGDTATLPERVAAAFAKLG